MHTFTRGAQIGHIGVVWHGKHWCQVWFSNISKKNPFFIFLVPKMAFLVKQVLEIWCNLGNNQFSHKLVPISWLVLIYREFSPYLANFTHLIEFNPVCWKSFKFELHLHANILNEFLENHFNAENE